MNRLTDEQRNIVFDYFFGVATEEQAKEAEKLIGAHAGAAEFYRKLNNSLKPLDLLTNIPCPDELVEGLLFRAENLARSSQLRLEQLIREQERKAVVGGIYGFWRNLAEVAAIAAVIIIFVGVSIPSLRSARLMAWQNRCQAQLSQIARGMTQYAADHGGSLPAVATASGEPWWKIGYQGNENYSNTRPLWLLVKGGYNSPADFVCPGRSQGRAIQLDPWQARKLYDFPSRKYITYSFRIVCPSEGKHLPAGTQILMADLNPVFEQLPNCFSKELYKRLTDELLKSNSNNHLGRGQNILFGSGSILFVSQRTVGPAADDIFTLKDKNTYHGTEVPSYAADTFLAP